MTDEDQTSAGSITSIEVVAVRIVCEAPEPAHTLDGALDLTATHVVETERPPQITVSEGNEAQSIGTYQIGSPAGKASAAWTGELKAPDRHEALSSLIRRDRGALRIGLVTAMLAGTLGLGWWTGLLDPRRLSFGPASTPPQQIALVDRALPDVDKPTISDPPANQVSTPAESSGISTPAETSSVSTPAESSRTVDDASAPHRGSVTPTDFVPTTAQKTTAMKPAVAPQRTQERHGRSRPRPVPETRPTTIEGWTVRSVSGGTAVLQGPDGIRRVSVGETVPGAGRIDSIVRWGNRWIVATSRGLISTD